MNALIKEGGLRSVRIGVKHIIPVSEIVAFLAREAGAVTAGAAAKSENPVDTGAATA